MAALHETQHDCRRHAQRHGGRRRRCARCGRTWSVHRRKLGRRRRRVDRLLPRMVLVDHEPTGRLGQRRRCSRDALYRRARRAFDWLVRQPANGLLPKEEGLILIADGLWFEFRGRTWVIYNMALRPVGADRAHLLDPVLLEGSECGRRWRQALATALTVDQRQRIRALVTDGFRGGKRIAAENGWVLQRCHWHLLATLRGFLGFRRKTARGPAMRRAIFRLAKEALSTFDEVRVQQICQELTKLTEHRYCHTRLRYVVGGFMNDVDDFRAYIRHPDLGLPRTISPLESMHDQMREAAGSANTPQAAHRRIRSLLKLKPEVSCPAAKTPQT